MEINKDSQVDLLSKISQTIIVDIDDSAIDVEPNRIKEKKESLKNTLINRLNIPISRSFTHSDDAIKNADIKNKEKVSFTLIDKTLDLVDVGKSKPINVKDTMLQNIKVKSFKSEASDIKPQSSVDSKSDLVLGNDAKVSIDMLMNQIEDFKKVILQRAEKVRNMKAELEESDRIVQELAMQYTEIEKNLREAESKNTDLENQILLRLNSQKELLANKLIDIENLETRMNERKENNDAQIKDFREKINSAIERTNGLNQEAYRRKEILNSLDNGHSENETDKKEGFSIKIA